MILTEDIGDFSSYNEIMSDAKTDIYKNSPFKIYKDLSSKKKGAEFEKISQEYAERGGLWVLPPLSSEHDRIIENFGKTEIKGSLLWGDGTNFRWQQIRPAQDYDTMVFLAVYPDRIDLYSASKETVRDAVEVQDERGYWPHNQHGGMKVNSGTFFLDGMPEDFPWMKKWEL
tara:strand:+ start:2521 stop:3036 length:516 start_codon:yes stop_codon:yes gene_type:complete